MCEMVTYFIINIKMSDYQLHSIPISVELCAMYCPHGFVLDAEGRPTCECSQQTGNDNEFHCLL